jgi:hypothetical protein
MNNYNKYIKYKNKYNALKLQLGGNKKYEFECYLKLKNDELNKDILLLESRFSEIEGDEETIKDLQNIIVNCKEKIKLNNNIMTTEFNENFTNKNNNTNWIDYGLFIVSNLTEPTQIIAIEIDNDDKNKRNILKYFIYMFLNFYYKENKYAVIICDVPQFKYEKIIEYKMKKLFESGKFIDVTRYDAKEYKYFILIIENTKLKNPNDNELKFKLIKLMRFWGFSTQTQIKDTIERARYLDYNDDKYRYNNDIFTRTPSNFDDEHTREINVYTMKAKDEKIKRHIGNIFDNKDEDKDITIKVIDNVK